MADSDITVSGLEIVTGFNQNFAFWTNDDPYRTGLTHIGLDAVEVWSASTNDRSASDFAYVAEGLQHAFFQSQVGTYYYWIKPRNVLGSYGEWYPVSPTAGIQVSKVNIPNLVGMQEGYSLKFDSSTGGDVDTGKFKFNNATFMSATRFTLSPFDFSYGYDLNWLSNWLASVVGATVIITKTVPYVFFAFKVNGFYGLSAPSGGWVYSITPLAQGGTIADSSLCYMQISATPFSPAGVLNFIVPTVEYTNDHTLVIEDLGQTIEMNKASANALTIPPNSDVAFPLKSVINVVQTGAGQTTLTAGAGVTLRSAVGLKTAAQYAMATLYQRAADEWVCAGNLTP